MERSSWVWLVLTGVAITSLVMLVGWWMPLPTVRYESDFTTKVMSALGTLLVLAVLIERSLSVVTSMIFSEVEHKVQASLRSRMSDLEAVQQESRFAADQQRMLARQALAAGNTTAFTAFQDQVSGGAAAARVAQTTELREQISQDQQGQADIDSGKERYRLPLAFGFAFIVAVAGVRTLTPLIQFDGATIQGRLIAVVDILLTAGLLAGGSNGLAKIIERFKVPSTTPAPTG